MNQRVRGSISLLLALLLAADSAPIRAAAASFVVSEPPFQSEVSNFSRQALESAGVWYDAAYAGEGVRNARRSGSDRARDAFSNTTRRTFFSRIAALAALVGIVRSARGNGYRAGVGDVLQQHLEFKVFDSAAVTPEANQVLRSLAQYMQVLSTDINGGQRTADLERALENSRQTLALDLLSYPGFVTKLRGHLAEMGLAYADRPEERINQIIYAGLPAYLSDFGLVCDFAFVAQSSAQNFDPKDDARPILERPSVYVVDAVNRNSLSLWGQAVTADELSITRTLVFDGIPLRTNSSDLTGRTVYDNVLLFENAFADEVVSDRNNSRLANPALRGLLTRTWMDMAPANPAILDDPLVFARDKGRAIRSTFVVSDAVRRRRARQDTRYHERQHLVDFRQGLYVAHPMPLIWADYDKDETGSYVAQEVDGILAGARNAQNAIDRQALINDWLQQFLDARTRWEALIYFNLIDVLLTSLSENNNWGRYAELRVAEFRGTSLRTQLAGQISDIRPEHWPAILDGMRAVRVRNRSAVKLPDVVDRKLLTQGPAYRAPRPAAPKKGAVLPGAFGYLIHHMIRAAVRAATLHDTPPDSRKATAQAA